MTNETDLLINNKSYTNKDFASIYPELIDTVTSMTDRWNPTVSNESDPGIVILKTLGFVGDKINYNLDKNTLENFLVSATQETSMRNLTDMIGYSMKYYVAPIVDVTFMYNASVDGNVINPNIIFNPLTTEVGSSDEGENINFILTSRVTLSRPFESMTAPCIQGRLKNLVVNTSGEVEESESNVIHLYNLDDNNRIYFPETGVAQNGVFIYDATEENPTTFWRVVDNLNYQSPLEKVFKFSYDSRKGLPYIEFPMDIANIIGNGIKIKYVVTNGLSGNVKAKVINALISSKVDWESLGLNEDNLYVRNLSASINGRDPESITEAYNSSKKIIGTFNTLDTCRDYANAIYNIYDESNEYPVVSNIQVCDRRDDFNHAIKIVSYDNLGDVTINASTEVTPFDLCTYPLTPIRKYSDYDESFTPLNGGKLSTYIKDEIEEFKNICHEYREPTSSDVYLFKNKYKLDANVITKYKVNDNERASILSNIASALQEQFNARELDYGKEIPFDSLLKCMENSDERISTISMMEPELSTYYINKGGKEYPLYNNDGTSTQSEVYYKYLAQNILSGNISLFDYNNKFNYEFGQSKLSGIDQVQDRISAIKTTFQPTFSSESGGEHSLTLLDNQVIQLLGPSILTELTYPAYINYCFIPSHSTTEIVQGTNYTFQQGDKLVINYTDSSQGIKWIIYGRDSSGFYKMDGSATKQEFSGIIQPNFDLSATSQESGGGRREKEIPTWVQNIIGGDSTWWFASLGARDELKIQKINKTTLNKKMKAYWLIDNAENKLPNEEEWLLKENEYFFYTDLANSQLVSIGSGTSIKLPIGLRNKSCKSVDIEEVMDKGILALSDLWYTYDFSVGNLEIIENSILTLTSGDSIDFVNLNGSFTLGNDPINPLLDGVTFESITYTINGETKTLDAFEGDEENAWRIKSRLDLDVSKERAQELHANELVSFDRMLKITPPSTWRNTLYAKDDNDIFEKLDDPESYDPSVDNVWEIAQNSTILGEGMSFYLSNALQMSGGVIDTRVVLNSSDVSSIMLPISIYCFEDTIEDTSVIARSSDEYISIQTSDELTTFNNEQVSLPQIEDENFLMMFYLDTLDGGSDSKYINLNLTNGSYKVKHYNSDEASDFTTKLSYGLNIISFERVEGVSTTSTISFALHGISGSDKFVFTIGTLDFYKGINSKFGDINDTTLLNTIKELDVNNDFYYNCRIDNSRYLEVESMYSPYALFDANNRANKMTLSQIAFNISTIDVVRSSRL